MLTLKNIKVHLGLSEETYAYTATVYWCDKKAVYVSNSGHGGCDVQHAVGSVTILHIDKWCADNLPTWEADGTMHDTDLEMWCADQVSRYLQLQDMRRLLRRKAVFTRPGETGLFSIGYKGLKKYDGSLADHALNKNPGATILNLMTELEALELYQLHAG